MKVSDEVHLSANYFDNGVNSKKKVQVIYNFPQNLKAYLSYNFNPAKTTHFEYDVDNLVTLPQKEIKFYENIDFGIYQNISGNYGAFENRAELNSTGVKSITSIYTQNENVRYYFDVD